MTDPTRRRLLVGCGTGLAALAGCSELSPFGNGNDGDDEYDREALRRAVGTREDLLRPDSFPVTLPAAFQNRHRDRGREYVGRVPAEPDLPNGALAEKLGEERREAAEGLESDASGRPLDRLDTWRRRRSEAASVVGTYLAATDDLARSDLEGARARVRSTLAEFEREWTYRGTDSVEATVVHATLEEHVRATRNKLHSTAAFPDDPTADAFHAGSMVGDVDDAGATVGDAGRLRAQYLEGDGDETDQQSHLTRVARAAQRLGRSASRTVDTVERYLDTDGDVFERDLEGTPAKRLFTESTRQVEWRRDDARRSRRENRHATAVLEAGRALVAATALDAVVEAIRDGRYQDEVTVADVEDARERTVEVLETAWDAEPQALAVELATPAYDTLRQASQEVHEHYSDPQQAVAVLVNAEALALPVPAATSFVVERLRDDGAA